MLCLCGHALAGGFQHLGLIWRQDKCTARPQFAVRVRIEAQHQARLKMAMMDVDSYVISGIPADLGADELGPILQAIKWQVQVVDTSGRSNEGLVSYLCKAEHPPAMTAYPFRHCGTWYTAHFKKKQAKHRDGKASRSPSPLPDTEVVSWNHLHSKGNRKLRTKKPTHRAAMEGDWMMVDDPWSHYSRTNYGGDAHHREAGSRKRRATAAGSTAEVSEELVKQMQEQIQTLQKRLAEKDVPMLPVSPPGAETTARGSSA